MPSRTVAWFLCWLGSQSKFSPQPYDQLAAVLRTQGGSEAADEILYAGRERERHEASSGLKSVKMFALSRVIGYGYYAWWSGLWFLGLLVVGAVAHACLEKEPKERPPTRALRALEISALRALGWSTPEPKKKEKRPKKGGLVRRNLNRVAAYVLSLLTYSLEMMLPLVRLRGQTRDFKFTFHDLYFTFHGIVGIALTTFLAAGLAGFTK